MKKKHVKAALQIAKKQPCLQRVAPHLCVNGCITLQLKVLMGVYNYNSSS